MTIHTTSRTLASRAEQHGSLLMAPALSTNFEVDIEQRIRELFERNHSQAYQIIIQGAQLHRMSVLNDELNSARTEVADLRDTLEQLDQDVIDSQETISSQEEEIQRLQAEMECLKQRHRQETASLRGEHAREIVALKSVHVAENAKNSSAIKNYVGRIDALNLENTNRKKDYAALQIEWKEHKKWREEYYDIIGGLRGRPGFSRSSALAKCRKHGI